MGKSMFKQRMRGMFGGTQQKFYNAWPLQNDARKVKTVADFLYDKGLLDRVSIIIIRLQIPMSSTQQQQPLATDLSYTSTGATQYGISKEQQLLGNVGPNLGTSNVPIEQQMQGLSMQQPLQ